MIPALLIRMCSGLPVATCRRAQPVTDSSELRSSGRKTIFSFPVASFSWPTAASPLLASRPAMTTRAPALVSALDVS